MQHLTNQGYSWTLIIWTFQLYMLWLNFILGLIFPFFCLSIIIIHYHTQKQKKIKFEPRIKLNHNIHTCFAGPVFHEYLPFKP